MSKTTFTQDWVVLENQDNLNPAINLAIEEFAVRQLPDSHSYLFIYRNAPSVIIGKHQNILLEAHLPFCWEHQIPVLRRLSGGGAVFHDLGNLNFSFVTNYSLQNFNRYRQFLKPIVAYFKRFKVELTIDERSNLRLNGKKVSGNAQFTSRKRLLSHGTLLVNSDLTMLRRVLKSRLRHSQIVQTKATASVRSRVTNIARESGKNWKMNTLIEELKQAIAGPHFVRYHFTKDEWNQIEYLAKTKYQNWEWNVARSPEVFVKKSLRCAGETIDFQYHLQEGYFREVEIFHPQMPFFTALIENKKLQTALWQVLNQALQNQPKALQTLARCLLKEWF